MSKWCKKHENWCDDIEKAKEHNYLDLVSEGCIAKEDLECTECEECEEILGLGGSYGNLQQIKKTKLKK